MPVLAYTLHDAIIARINLNGAMLGLLSGAPAPDGSDASTYEPASGLGYQRQAVTFGAAVRGTGALAGSSTITSTNALVFGPVVTSDWPQLTYAAIFDASNGALLAYSPLPAAKVVKVGDTLSFGIGSLQLRFR